MGFYLHKIQKQVKEMYADNSQESASPGGE